jgi:hypothetical protein
MLTVVALAELVVVLEVVVVICWDEVVVVLEVVVVICWDEVVVVTCADEVVVDDDVVLELEGAKIRYPAPAMSTTTMTPATIAPTPIPPLLCCICIPSDSPSRGTGCTSLRVSNDAFRR